MERFDEALECCDKALPLVRYSKRLTCKVLMRKANALKASDMEAAVSIVEEALRTEPGNRQAKQMSSDFFQLKNESVFADRKKQCDEELGNRMVDTAIASYKQLLKDKLTRSSEKKAAVRANLCICHLIKESWEDVVQEAERGLDLKPSDELRLKLLTRKAKAHGALG
jgi:tetratricopeptide (TPR) repeat protein